VVKIEIPENIEGVMAISNLPLVEGFVQILSSLLRNILLVGDSYGLGVLYVALTTLFYCIFGGLHYFPPSRLDLEFLVNLISILLVWKLSSPLYNKKQFLILYSCFVLLEKSLLSLVEYHLILWIVDIVLHWNGFICFVCSIGIVLFASCFV
jgi:hypothetical protein